MKLLFFVAALTVAAYAEKSNEHSEYTYIYACIHVLLPSPVIVIKYKARNRRTTFIRRELRRKVLYRHPFPSLVLVCQNPEKECKRFFSNAVKQMLYKFISFDEGGKKNLTFDFPQDGGSCDAATQRDFCPRIEVDPRSDFFYNST